MQSGEVNEKVTLGKENGLLTTARFGYSLWMGLAYLKNECFH